jgi:hypothetical protein
LPKFRNNTQYPVERIGKIKMPLDIDFVEPQEFGFSKKLMEDNNFPLIVYGHVGAVQCFQGGLNWLLNKYKIWLHKLINITRYAIMHNMR